MELFAAVDLMDRGAVRLVQGEFGRSVSFGDPLALAERHLDGGARWLHVVDLDAARTGSPANRAAVLEIARAAHRRGARIEVGGGIRTGGDVDALCELGMDRVVLGTTAVERPDVARDAACRHPGRVAVGLDYRRRDGRAVPAVRGWTGAAALDVPAVLGALGGVPLAALVVTAIERDGTGEGPDTEGLAAVLDTTELDVIASGGVGGAGDLVSLAALESPVSRRTLAGVVVGRALADGTVTVEEAMAACAASG